MELLNGYDNRCVLLNQNMKPGQAENKKIINILTTAFASRP